MMNKRQHLKRAIAQQAKNKGGAFDADYQAVLDYATSQGYTLPSPAQRLKENAYLVNAKSNGSWARNFVFYNTYTDGDRDFAKINWKDPSNYTLQESGSITFGALTGFIGDGGVMYTNINPSTLSFGSFGLNNASIWANLDMTNDITEKTHIGSLGFEFEIIFSTYFKNSRSNLNSSTLAGSNIGSTSSAGLYMLSRSSATHEYIYRVTAGGLVANISSAISTASNLYFITSGKNRTFYGGGVGLDLSNEAVGMSNNFQNLIS